MEYCVEIVGQVEDGNGTQRFVGQRDEGMPETSTVLCCWFIEAMRCAALLYNISFFSAVFQKSSCAPEP